jgi:hypothetical protein
MKTKLHLVLVLSTLSALRLWAGESVTNSLQSQLSEHLKGLERVLGTWEFLAEDQKGAKVATRLVFQAAAGGQAVTAARSGASSALFSYYYDPELRKVICIAITDFGAIVKTVYAEEMLTKNEFAALSYITTRDGKQGTSIEHVKWVGKDQILWNRTDIFVEGEKRPSSPETIMNRVK